MVKKKLNVSNIITLFCIICFLLNSSYCYMLHNDKASLLSLFCLSIIILLYYGFYKNGVKKKKFYNHPMTYLAIGILFSMIINLDFSYWGSYIRQFLILIIAVLVSFNLPSEKFKKHFVNFMFIVSIISIIAWIITNIFKFNLPLPIMISSRNGAYFNEYKNGLLFFIYLHQPFKIMGPFWEPGIYASMAIIALILDNNPKKNIIFYIGILLSFSTAGYILLLIFLIIKIINKNKHKVLLIFLIIIVLLGFLFLKDRIILLLANFMPNIFGKIANESVSKMTRINCPLIDLLIFIKSPIWGVGINNYLIEWNKLSNIYLVESRTSTITYFIANFGLIGLLYGYTAIKGILSQKNIHPFCKVLIIIIFVSILTKEPNYLNIFTTTFLAYLISNNNFLYNGIKKI